jgi:hypothetical protein
MVSSPVRYLTRSLLAAIMLLFTSITSMASFVLFGAWLVCVACATGTARFCSDEDLRGNWGLFSVYVSGNGTTQAGTPQVLSFIWPSGSPVRAIVRVTLVESAKGNYTKPRDTGPLPSFKTGSRKDKAGGVAVTSPVNLPPGPYVLRADIDVPRANCYLDTSEFTVVASNRSCAPGTSECTSAQAYRRCGRDGWEREKICPEMEACMDGVCV